MVIIFFFIIFFIVSSKAWTIENCTLDDIIFMQSQPPDNVVLEFIETYTSIELDSSTGAKALDGSNYKFYFTPGKEPDNDKFFIYWQGGAFCGSDGEQILQSCYDKLSTMYGTSSDEYWAANGTEYQETTPWGALSSMEDFNPLFWKWNKVRMLPLDGANYQGSLEEPLVYNETNLWFRGFNNTMATLEYMRKNHNLFNASEIILSGGSAGGIAAMVWSNYLKDYFPKNIKISLVLDGALFMDSYNEVNSCYLFRYSQQNLLLTLQLNNTELYQNCRYANNETWKCLMIEHIYDSIDYPVFLSNAQTDIYELTNWMGIHCFLSGGPTYCDSIDRRKITKVRELFLKMILKMKKIKPYWGFFMRSCFEHNLMFSMAWYGHSMDVFNAEIEDVNNLQNSLYEWYINKDSNTSYIDLLDWLHNPRCVYVYE